ncbi:MAG: gluconate 2-dehydrogenase subunit 3 family protein [Acidobacteria bacterium]|nr:gluconate 2-dehydrogenase subunit 3 family protein [Acidobacteriota bacterium]
MSSRRDLLQIGAALTAATVTAQEHHPSDQEIKPAKKTARFFKPAEMELLAKVVDRIIPRSDTPGAADANVHYFIDWQCHTNPKRGAQVRRDLRWIALQGFAGGGQVALLTQWSKSAGEPKRIFQSFKDLTVDGYYGTREGLQVELGWNANTFVREFKGCTHKEHA